MSNCHSNKFNNQISNFSLSIAAWLLTSPEFRLIGSLKAWFDIKKEESDHRSRAVFRTSQS